MWVKVSFVYNNARIWSTDRGTNGHRDFDSKTVRMHSQSHGKNCPKMSG